MRKSLSIAIAIILLILAAVSYWAMRTESERKEQNISSAAQSYAAADYPEAMWPALQQIEDISISEGIPSDIPSNLDWQDGSGLKEIGDPAAIKGGSISLVNVGPFPAHFRFLGEYNVFFHYTLYKQVDIKMLHIHPSEEGEKKIIPGLAQSWAVAPDGKTVYLRLNPAARYSNNRPVRAKDILLSVYLRSSPYSQNLSYLPALRQRIEAIRVYDNHTLSITLRDTGLLAAYRASELLSADEPSFYAEFGPDYADRYSQRIPPTTGAYRVEEGDIIRGRKISMSRVKNWWAHEINSPYYRNRANVDRIEYNFLSDESQTWEFLSKGKIDLIQTRNVAAWQQRLTQSKDLHEGRIEKRRFTAQYPLPPYGIYLNCATLPDLHLREGLIYAMDIDKGLDIISRGEQERLSCFSDGYGIISPPAGSVPRRAYDPSKARAAFAKAGYSERGEDGILSKPDGTRLSVSMSYTPSEKISTLMQILSDSAKHCGAEIRLEPGPWQRSEERVIGKTYELAFWADVATNPLPQLEHVYHSKNVDVRELNIQAVADSKLDSYIEQMQQAESQAALAAATLGANLRIQQLAVWLPGWKENRGYIASWRRVRFPNTPDCRLSTPAPYGITEAHLYWVDDEGHPNQGIYPEVDEVIEP